MVARGPVSVNWQSVFMFIPIVDLWAAYRIQKLRMFLLIFAVGFGGASILIEIALAGSIDGFLESNSDFDVYYIGLAIILIQYGTAVILIRMWSRRWNEKFQTENS